MTGSATAGRLGAIPACAGTPGVIPELAPETLGDLCRLVDRTVARATPRAAPSGS
jgi:hypothetical protein